MNNCTLILTYDLTGRSRSMQRDHEEALGLAHDFIMAKRGVKAVVIGPRKTVEYTAPKPGARWPTTRQLIEGVTL